MVTCFLISCVSRKARCSAPAKTLYASDWCNTTRAYLHERLRPGDRWFILFARQHPLEPGGV